MKEIELSNTDPKTGQRFFSPKISKHDTISVIDRPFRDIFSDLHEEKKLFERKQKEMEEKNIKQLQNLSNHKKTSLKSDDIHNYTKIECFNKLFELLDHDNDQVISYSEDFAENANAILSEEIRQILNPILTEMKEHGDSLNLEEFITAVNQLYYILNISQRRQLLNWFVNMKRSDSPRKRRSMEMEDSVLKKFPFRPEVNSKNASQVLNSPSRSVHIDLFDRGSIFLKKRESIIQEKIEQKIKNETKGKLTYY
jgi:hypothetical protein